MEYSNAVEIADRVWWVGNSIPDDPFQCHVYLIEDEEESILIDPGSRLTWKETRRKIEQVIPIVNIKYIICHHQDPDITSAVDLLLSEIGRDDKIVITHWRTETLLKHYNWRVEFYRVDENGWRLKTKSRELEFVFTPYMHFAGAFCTFDKISRVLFSSDIFGAFTPEFQLFATDENSYFENMKPFHSHYMPSREIVINGLKEIKKRPFSMIAPQHGSIISYEIGKELIKRLSNLDVGLFLDYGGDRDVQKLTKANEILSEIFETATFVQGSVYDELNIIFEQLNELFELKRVVAYVVDEDSVMVLDSELKMPYKSPYLDSSLLQNYINTKVSAGDGFVKVSEIFDIKLYRDYTSFVFVSKELSKDIEGLYFLIFEESQKFSTIDIEILKHLKKPMHLLVKRELEYYHSILIKNAFSSSVDSLTRLFTKQYIEKVFINSFKKIKREDKPISAVMFSIREIKEINSQYGEDIGDLVIKHFTKIIERRVRDGDYLFRFEGNKFLLILIDIYEPYVIKIVDDIRDMIEKESIKIGEIEIKYSFFVGIANYKRGESLKKLIKKADLALAKSIEEES